MIQYKHIKGGINMAGILKTKWEYRHYGVESTRKLNNEIKQSIKNGKYPKVTDISKIAEDEHWYTPEERVGIEKNAQKGLYPCCIVYSNKDLCNLKNVYHTFVKNLSKRNDITYPFKLDRISSDTHTKYIFYANDELREALEKSEYNIFSRGLSYSSCINSIDAVYDVFIVEGENLYLFESSDHSKNFSHQYTPTPKKDKPHVLWLENVCKKARYKRLHNKKQASGFNRGKEIEMQR